MTRYLIHGPCLNDPGELLFFDAWVQPIAQATLRPFDSPPLSIGYPVREAWPQPVLDALQAAGRLVSIGELIWSGVEPSAAGAEPSPQLHSRIDEAVAIGTEAMYFPLSTPASDAEVRAWLGSIDLALRQTAARLARRGHRVSSKQFADTVTQVFKPGWELAVALVLPAFPRVDRVVGNLEDWFAFLADGGTIERREALLGWPERASGAPATALADEAVAAAHALAQWVEASGLASGRGPVELVWAVDDAAQAEALAAAPISDAARQVAVFRTRGLAVGEAAGAGRESPLMLVGQRPRGYPAS